MLTDEQKRSFLENGFVKVGRVVSDEQADAMRERLFAIMENHPADSPKTDGEAGPERISQWRSDGERIVVQIVNIWEADPMFHRHIFNPALTTMAAELMATDTVRVWHDQVQYKPPVVGGPTDWHQDHPYWPIIQPADLVSAWMALDDVDVENGCMWMVPGSHRWGPHKGGTIGTNGLDFSPEPDLSLLPAGISLEPVPCEVGKGEALFHHCLTWHGSPPNRSSRGRPGVAVHYMPGHTRYVPQGATHLVEHNVEVKPGEILQGKHFPVVYAHGAPVRPADE